MTVTVFVGDVRDQLRRIPDASVDCVVSSPPYWAVRDYGVSGQIGMEPSFAAHVEVLLDVFREVRRVMTPTATFWLNYGDSYASGINGRKADVAKAIGADDRTHRDKPVSNVGNGFRPKELLMMPNRLAIALADDGWLVRSEIVWNKTNPKPERVNDRPAAVHEKIWLLTKSERYFFEIDAMKEPVTGTARPRRADGRAALAKGGTPGDRRVGSWRDSYQPKRRNPRNVWTFSVEGFRGAHFATFPRELVRRCLLGGCRAGGHVLDPFGGSGTTAIVADSLGLDCTLIEINPGYAEMARARLAAERPKARLA